MNTNLHEGRSSASPGDTVEINPAAWVGEGQSGELKAESGNSDDGGRKTEDENEF